MPRYEFKEGSSSKFWEIELEGESFTVRYGRIGTAGQESTKDFDSSSEARKEYGKLIAEKEKKGYQLVGGGASAPASNLKSNPEIEALIDGDPENADQYLVYADWLQQNGDPRGELIVVQHQLATASKAQEKELKARAKAILKEHLESWVDEDAAELIGADDWHFGFLKRLRVHGDQDSGTDPVPAFETLLQSPLTRFLQKVVSGEQGNEDGPDSQPVIDALLRFKRPTLRSLVIGDVDDYWDISMTAVGNVSKLWAAYPNLEEVELYGGTMTLGKITAPKLKEFAAQTGGLNKKDMKSVATAEWPNIEKLEVWFGQENYGGDCKVKDVKPLLERTDLPKLKHLGLMNAEFTDDIVEALVKSPMLKQLETLNLSMGCLSNKGVQTILKNKAAFAHLKELDISDNAIEELGAVAKVCAKVHTAGQSPDRVSEDGYRYTSVGE